MVASVLLVSTSANALVGKGVRSADFVVEETNGSLVRMSSFAGRPVLVIYEDKLAVDWNNALKKRLARDRTLPKSVVVLPVADMQRWKSWPARYFAKKELGKQAVKAGRSLYGDWNGEAARSLGVAKETSSVVLFGEDGLVRWAAAGRLGADRVEELIGLIREASPVRKQGAAKKDAVILKDAEIPVVVGKAPATENPAGGSVGSGAPDSPGTPVPAPDVADPSRSDQDASGSSASPSSRSEEVNDGISHHDAIVTPGG